MNITINGKKLELEKAITIKELLESRGVNLQAVVVEYNFELPEREQWSAITLKEGDNVEVVKFIGGG